MEIAFPQRPLTCSTIPPRAIALILPMSTKLLVSCVIRRYDLA
jgi:hypothetical protein